MRAIVSLLKFFVGAAFLFYTAVLAFLIGASLFGFSQGVWAGLGVVGVGLAIAGFVLLVLITGTTALLISAHDRLCEISASIAERNQLARDFDR